MNVAECFDCQRPYGDKHGFPDLVIPYWAWKQISPTKDEGGLLCPSCICKRLYDANIKCKGAFTSGSIESVSETTIGLIRRLENIETAVEFQGNISTTIVEGTANDTKTKSQ